MKNYTKGFSLWVSVLILAVVVGGLFTWSQYGRRDVTEDTIPKQEIQDVSSDFGDDGDEGGTQQDASLAVKANIIGKWQDTTDPKFTREFTRDKVVDISVGEKTLTAAGTWEVFTTEDPDKDFKGTLEKDAVYIKIRTSNTNLYFKLAKLTPESLELIYLDRGNVLSFTKVN